MQPVYERKANPKDRVTWMDRFVATEPTSGFQDVVDLVQNGRAKAVFTAVMAIRSEARKAAA